MNHTDDDVLPHTFRSRIDASGDCWLWTGPLLHNGYGIFYIGSNGNGTYFAHRYIWETLVGLIPPSMTIDHLCFVKRCVNPDHLRVLSRGDNSRAGAHRKGTKSACPHGHPYNAANTYIQPSSGKKRCRECHRLDNLARWFVGE